MSSTDVSTQSSRWTPPVEFGEMTNLAPMVDGFQESADLTEGRAHRAADDRQPRGGS